MSNQTQYRNNLLYMRKKLGFGQKQVALLLGHKTTDQISRYEQGLIRPNLKNAFKLGLIYRSPIDFLFADDFKFCQKELKKAGVVLPEKASSAVLMAGNLGDTGQIPAESSNFCTFENNLRNAGSETLASESARRHITELIRLRSQTIDRL